MSFRRHGRSGVRRVASVRRVLFAVTATILVSAPVWAQVEALGHPTVAQRISTLGMSPSEGYRFIVFGDQKELWTDDFPRLLDQVHAEMSANELLFMLDTGDIVDNGSKASEFDTLRGHLARVPDLPYLVGVGNHELQPKKGGDTLSRAHQNTAAFLGDDYAYDRMFFTKQIGRVRFLFLNTHDLPNVYPRLYKNDPDVEQRAAAQLKWLEEELRKEVHPTVAISHHAFVQSAKKHRDEHATVLWNHTYDDFGGRTLPEMLSDGGVDLDSADGSRPQLRGL